MEKNKLTLPISIIIGFFIFGFFFYSAEKNKQESIERQQEVEIAFKRSESETVRLEKEEENRAEEEAANFKKNLECQDLLKSLKQRWSNVVGIYYDEYINTCMVKYTKNGKTEEGAIEDMQDSN